MNENIFILPGLGAAVKADIQEEAIEIFLLDSIQDFRTDTAMTDHEFLKILIFICKYVERVDKSVINAIKENDPDYIDDKPLWVLKYF